MGRDSNQGALPGIKVDKGLSPINDNSEEKLSFSSIISIFEALITKSQLSSWPLYFSCLFGAFRKQHWSKAIFLDRLLADIFISLWKSSRPDFSVLFLNSGAHIQHHYMCSSKPYKGSVENPEWYISKGKDPLLEILEMYDSVLKEMQNLNNVRLMIAVGLRQIPYEKPTFYWRLKDHDDFLIKLGLNFKRTQPRMTRDFLIEFENEKDMIDAQKVLLNVKSIMIRVAFVKTNYLILKFICFIDYPLIIMMILLFI